MAITKLEGPALKAVRECAQSALDVATGHELIRPLDGQAGSLQPFQRAPYIKPLTVTELKEEEDGEGEDAGDEKETETGEAEDGGGHGDGDDDDGEDELGEAEEGEDDVDEEDKLKENAEERLAGGTDGAEDVCDRLEAASVKDGEEGEKEEGRSVDGSHRLKPGTESDTAKDGEQEGGSVEGSDRLKPGTEPDTAKDGEKESGMRKDESLPEEKESESVSSSEDGQKKVSDSATTENTEAT